MHIYFNKSSTLLLSLILMCSLFATSISAQGAVFEPTQSDPITASTKPSTANHLQTALFAGGCFWCLQKPYDSLDGVISTSVGFSGGKKENPSYKDVSQGGTGHIESIEVTYDPEIISYTELLNTFWVNIDPTDNGGQFCDRGPEYQSAIFVHNKAEQAAAEASLLYIEQNKFINTAIVTPILPASDFYPAEEYHQKYYQKNPIRYKYYRYRCGRDNRLDELWKGAKSLR